MRKRDKAPKFDPLNIPELIGHIERLIDTGIFCRQEAGGPLFIAAYAWLIINLYELVAEAERRCPGMIVLDHVRDEEPKDATTFFFKARSAVAHPGSGERTEQVPMGWRRGGFEIVSGPSVGEVRFAGKDMSMPFADISVSAGNVRVLIERQAIEAFRQACALLATP